MSIPTSPWTSTGPARDLGDDLRAGAPARERSGESPVATWSRLVAAGLTGVLFDRAVGGSGASVAAAAEDVAAVAGGDLVGALLLAGHHTAVATLRAAGPAGADLQRRAADDGRLLSPALPGPAPLAFDTRDGATRIDGVAAEVHGAGEALGFVATARDAAASQWIALLPVERPGIVVEELGLRAGLRRLPAGRAQFLGTSLEPDETRRVAPGERDLAVVARGLRAVFEAAAVAGAARGSVEASATLTRARVRPRPVPGATSGITDPIGQVVIGEALGPIDGAHALALDAAAAFDAVFEPGGDADAEALLVRALAAIDVALTIGLEQGERVYELVGTSGSGNVHGFDALWRDVRTLSLAWPRAERRRAVGRAFLEAR